MKKDIIKCHDTILRGKATRSIAALCLTASLSIFPVYSYASSNYDVHSEVNHDVNQSRTVKGRVLDETDTPLIGVSIHIKDTSLGTITDLDGNFSINLPEGKNTLEFSYIGYLPQTVKITNNLNLTIKLEPDTKTLDEVVVIGYGTIKKRDLTGAVSSVKASEITLSPGSNPMAALQGKVAGLDITQTSGQAGSGVTMQLRGNRSISADGGPLFIIDGLPGDYSTINPNDIASIEVLKDASSTAVYGSQGANGVIIITTKKGEAGKMAINFNMHGGFNGWSKLPKMRMGDSYVNVLREARQIAGTYSDDEGLFSSPEAYQASVNNQYIDWADELLQNGFIQNYSVSASGGTERTKAYFSLNFSDEKGQYSGDNYKVYSTNMNIDQKVTNWMNAGVNLQAAYTFQNRAYAKLVNALTTVPLGTTHNEDGSFNVTPVPGDGNTVNLLLDQDRSVYRDNRQNFRMYFNPYIEIRPFKGFSVQSRLNTTLTYNRTNYFQGIGSYQYYTGAGVSAQGTNSSVFARITQTRNYNYKWENIFTYSFDINKVHQFNLTAVTSWNHDQYNYTQQYQDNIKNNSYLWHNMSGNGQVYSNYEMSKGMGLVGRINYSFLDRYLLSASVRHDGSSRLAAGNRWSTFPAFSLGWIVSEEKFMEGTKGWLDNLKIRGGYGVTGTQSIPPYSSVAILEDGYYSLGGEQTSTYYFSENISNRNLTWERSHNTNIGIDMSFLNRRIDIVADYYNTKTDGVILAQNLPIVNGGYNASTLYYINRNIAKTRTKGFELALNTHNFATRDFTWDTSLTLTINKEKILSLADGTSDIVNIAGSDYWLSKGHTVHSFYHYKIDGMWQNGEANDASVFGCQPGDIKINVPGMVRVEEGKYYKLGEDGKPMTNDAGDIIYYTADNQYAYSGNDYQILGQKSPKWTMGFQNRFNYKGFDLTIYMFWRRGQMINYDMLGYYDPSGKGNFPTYFNYWTPDNPSNDFPALNADRALNSYTGYSALNYVDGSFFKIKNITLGYTLPQNMMGRSGISNFRVYATLTNPLVIAKSHLSKDYDPEMGGSLNYPLTKQLVFGVNLSF